MATLLKITSVTSIAKSGVTRYSSSIYRIVKINFSFVKFAII